MRLGQLATDPRIACVFSFPVPKSDKFRVPFTIPEVIIKAKIQAELLPSGNLGSELTPSSSRQLTLGSLQVRGCGYLTLPTSLGAPREEGQLLNNAPRGSEACLERVYLDLTLCKASRGMV